MAYSWHDDDMRCTKCKKPTAAGWGIQFMDDKDREQRYCTPCYTKMCQKEDEAWERNNQEPPPTVETPPPA